MWLILWKYRGQCWVSPLGEYSFEEEGIIDVSSSVGISVGEVSVKREESDLVDLLCVDIGMELGPSLDLSGGCVAIKLDGSSVVFDRGFVGLLALGTDAVTVASVSERAYALRSVVIRYLVVRYF